MVPGAYITPPMVHLALQVPAVQIPPAPQLVVLAFAGWLQTPAPMLVTHLSSVHGLPSSVHAVLLALLVHAVALCAGTQVWHSSSGFGAPLAKNTPLMMQPGTHVPCWQVLPPPQSVSSVTGESWLQTPALQLSIEQGLPSSGHDVASSTADQAVLSLAASQT
jgi:hypothetical protein